MSKLLQPTSGENPVTLWDIEGVFIIHASTVRGYRPPTGYIPFRDNAFMFFSPQHSQLVRPIMLATEAYYLSTSDPQSREHLAGLLQFPEMQRVKHYETSDGTKLSKWHMAIDHYFPGRPVAWVSDDHELGDEEWADARRGSGIDTALISIDRELGLQPDDVDMLVQWLGGHGVHLSMQ